MYNYMWESVCLRNACKRGLEYYPVPNGVCLNSSGDTNVLSVLAVQLIAMGLIWSMQFKKFIFGMAVCVVKGLQWRVKWDESLIMLR